MTVARPCRGGVFPQENFGPLSILYMQGHQQQFWTGTASFVPCRLDNIMPA